MVIEKGGCQNYHLHPMALKIPLLKKHMMIYWHKSRLILICTESQLRETICINWTNIQKTSAWEALPSKVSVLKSLVGWQHSVAQKSITLQYGLHCSMQKSVTLQNAKYISTWWRPEFGPMHTVGSLLISNVGLKTSLADTWTKKFKQIKKYMFPVHTIAVLQIYTCIAKMSFSASSSARSDQAEGWSRRCMLTLEQNVYILRFPELWVTSRISLGVDTVISPWSDTLLQQNAVIPS